MAWDDVEVDDGTHIYYSANHNETINQIKQRQPFHGFENRTDSTITWNSTTKTVTITGTFNYYYQGTKITHTNAASPSVTMTAGQIAASALYYCYFNSAGTLTIDTSIPDYSICCPVCLVYWNTTSAIIRDERHGHDRNLAWHSWAHNTIGCRYGSGLALTTAGSAGTATFSVAAGTIWDEDIRFTTVAPTTTGHIFYQNSASSLAFVDTTTTIPFYWNGGTSRVRFVDSTNSYALTDCSAARYVNVWVYATPDLDYAGAIGSTVSFVVETIAGNNGYNSVSAARQVQPPNLSLLTSVSPEIKLIYRLVVSGDGTIATAVAADDYRSTSTVAGGAVTSVDATSVTFTPTGSVSATNVQGAISELDTEKAPANPLATDSLWDAKGDLVVGSGANTAAKYTLGAAGAVLTTDSSGSTGVLWRVARRSIFLSCAGGWASTTYGDSGFTTTEASTTSGATPTTFNIKGALFDATPPASDRNHEFAAPMPANWDGGTVTAKPYVMCKQQPAANDTLILGIRGAVIRSGEAATPLTFGIGASSFFSLSTTDINKLLVGNSATPSVGVTNITLSCSGTAAGGDWVHWKVSRAGYDTYSGGATVLGWLITYNTNSYSDA